MKKFGALLLLTLGIARAEPGALTQSLMQEPASLFDIGMMRLDTLTAEFENRVGLSWTGTGGSREFFKAEVNSNYDSTDDRIYVSFLIMTDEATSPQMEEGCGVSFRQMGIWLTKSVSSLFSHVGEDAVPGQLFDGLSQQVVMTCYVSSKTSSADGRFWANLSLADFLRGEPMTIGRRN